MPQESEEEPSQSSPSSPTQTVISMENLNSKIGEWTKILRNGSMLVAERGPDNEPYKNIYKAIETVTKLRNEVGEHGKSDPPNKIVSFYINFALIHIHSSLAKWLESCDELSQAEKEHIQ